jgi:hypothetical protein
METEFGGISEIGKKEKERKTIGDFTLWKCHSARTSQLPSMSTAYGLLSWR